MALRPNFFLTVYMNTLQKPPTCYKSYTLTMLNPPPEFSDLKGEVKAFNNEDFIIEYYLQVVQKGSRQAGYSCTKLLGSCCWQQYWSYRCWNAEIKTYIEKYFRNLKIKILNILMLACQRNLFIDPTSALYACIPTSMHI